MIDRRQFTIGLLAVGCGGGSAIISGMSQEELPPEIDWAPQQPPFIDKDREYPDVSDPPYAAIEVLNTLSLRSCDPFQAVKIAAGRGYKKYRTLSTLARAPESEWSSDWLVLPGTEEWYNRRDAYFDACRRFGVIGELCLFDRADRPNRELYVMEYLDERGLDWWDGSTWGASRPGSDTSLRIGDRLLRGLAPAPHVLIEDCNEPGITMSTQMFDPLCAWLKGKGYRVSRGTEVGYNGPYPDCDELNEHAWGPPGLVEPWPPFDRLEELARANPGVYINLSTDGFLAESEIGALGVSREVQRRGFSFSALFRRTPDMWTDAQYLADEAVAK